MSRIGKRPLPIPEGCTVTIDGQMVRAAGPKGTLELMIRPEVTARQEGTTLLLRAKDSGIKSHRALWGLYRALVRNMMEGVTKGYERRLEIQGVGYRAQAQGTNLVLSVGFSHSVTFAVPQGVNAAIEKNTIILQSADKQLVGEVAAKLRRIRPPEPYKGKGIRYTDEIVRRKAGKVVKAAGAA